ncbi:MAG: Mov34/MPN/PAD-1 family protein [Candidatus Hodarchaeota archaeon]
MSENEKRREFFSQNSESESDENEKLAIIDSTIKKAKPVRKDISLDVKVKSVTILGHLISHITDYSVKAKPMEAIGLLGGKVERPHELLITKIHYVTTGDEISVSFLEDDFEAFEEILDDISYCLGWWHSHPGYGLFLSQTDISTHIYSFQLHNEHSIALVIDPTKIYRKDRAEFKCYQVVGEQGNFDYKEIASYIRE